MEAKEKKQVVTPKETELATSTPADMIKIAVSAGTDLKKLEKLLILQERWEANEAKKSYNQAMAIVSAAIPSVTKTLLNPQTHSKYAPLDKIIEAIKPIYSKEGFSLIFYEGETSKEGHIRIMADVIHKQGHKEIYHYDVPLDGVGLKGNPNMTKIHAKASSTSYGKRYLTCMIFNVPTGDDDGNAASPIQYIITKQVSEFCDVLDNVSQPELRKKQFLSIMKVEKLEDILSKDYTKAKQLLASIPRGEK